MSGCRSEYTHKTLAKFYHYYNLLKLLIDKHSFSVHPPHWSYHNHDFAHNSTHLWLAAQPQFIDPQSHHLPGSPRKGKLGNRHLPPPRRSIRRVCRKKSTPTRGFSHVFFFASFIFLQIPCESAFGPQTPEGVCWYRECWNSTVILAVLVWMWFGTGVCRFCSPLSWGVVWHACLYGQDLWYLFSYFFPYWLEQNFVPKVYSEKQYVYLELVCPLFRGFNPPKKDPFLSKQGSFMHPCASYPSTHFL